MKKKRVGKRVEDIAQDFSFDHGKSLRLKVEFFFKLGGVDEDGH